VPSGLLDNVLCVLVAAAVVGSLLDAWIVILLALNGAMRSALAPAGAVFVATAVALLVTSACVHVRRRSRLGARG
jgi:hypothetical protein